MRMASAEKMALSALCATLFLSGLAFMPHAQHVFWAPENLAARLLAPAAFLILLGAGWGAAPAGGFRFSTGLGLLWLLIGCWFLSAGLALRLDLAARELALWLCPPLVFGAAWILAREREARARILFFILAAGCLQALYGLIQSAGLEPFVASVLGPHSFGFDQLNWAVSFGGRAGAFFGNPNFLGGHLALLLPLALALAMDERRKGWRRRLAWAVAMLLAAGLVVTQTRGAWLGAAAGLGAMLLACRRHMRGLITRNRAALGALGAAAALALLLFFAGHAQNLSRLGSVFSGDEELSRRFTLMRCSLSLAARHPLLGVGPGNFRIFFPSVETAGLSHEELLTRPYIVSEHAHNDLIQMAAEAGWPAALLMLALSLWLYRTLIRGLGKGSGVERSDDGSGDGILLAGLIGSLLALQVHGLANFPFLISPTQMTAWALAAIGLRLCLAPAAEGAEAGEEPRPNLKSKTLAALGLALFFFGAVDAGRMLNKDALWWVGEGEYNLKNFDRAEIWLFRALDLDRKEDRLWLLHGRSLMERNFTANATGSLKEAISLNPHFHEARVSLGRAYVGLGDYANASETLQVTAEEAPNFSELWEPLAASLYMQGRYDQAVLAYDWASSLHANSAAMLENKSAALGSLGRYPEALKALAEAEAMTPGRAKNSVNRAITHFKMGVKALAIMDLKEALRRDPSDSQAKELAKVIH